MGLIREPKEVDFSFQSKSWTDEELHDFRKLMVKLKLETKKLKSRSANKKEKVKA